jgi:outer membrane protein TolC
MRCAIRTAFTVMVFAGLPAIQAQTPLSIEDAVSQALLNRPELRAASERLIASKHLQTQAKLRPNPRFYFQTEDLRASNRRRYRAWTGTPGLAGLPCGTRST